MWQIPPRSHTCVDICVYLSQWRRRAGDSRSKFCQMKTKCLVMWCRIRYSTKFFTHFVWWKNGRGAEESAGCVRWRSGWQTSTAEIFKCEILLKMSVYEMSLRRRCLEAVLLRRCTHSRYTSSTDD